MAQARDERIGAISAHDVPIRLADGSLVELFDDGGLLFSEQEQRLGRLEGASALLAPLLQRGATFSELRAELERWNIQAEAANAWIISLLHQLAGMSLLQTDALHSAGPSSHAQFLSLASFTFSLSYESTDLRDRLAPVFAHLQTGASGENASFRIADFGIGLVRMEEGDSAALVPRDQLAIHLKTLLLERLFESRANFAALHAALLSHAGRGVLLLGSPGAGKSTLALALMRAGYDYGSDDVALVNRDGSVTGVPLAPGVKKGSWEIAEDLGAKLTPLPAHMRPDGQHVRFAQFRGDEVVPTCPVGTIVNLRRESGTNAEVRRMSSEETLAELLRESRASGGRCNIETMTALSQLVRGAESFHLHYAEAMEAADLIASRHRS